MSTIALYSLLNISDTVRERERLGSKGPPIRKGLWGTEWSRLFGNNWRCYFIANY